MKRLTRMRRAFHVTAATAAVAASVVAVVFIAAVGLDVVAEAFCTSPLSRTIHHHSKRRGLPLTSAAASDGHHRRHARRRVLRSSFHHGEHAESGKAGARSVADGAADLAKSQAPVTAAGINVRRMFSRAGTGDAARSAGVRRAARWRPRSMAPLCAAADQPSEFPTDGRGGGGGEGSKTASAASSLPGVGGESTKEGSSAELGAASARGGRSFGRITDETLDLIRSSTSITDVISQYVEMKPAGRGMTGCCPFHDERTPSFSVDESRGSYHCFGCSASGDVITFMMQIEGMGFREVVRDLAEAAGISFESESSVYGGPGGARVDSGAEKARREARERLSLVLQMAAQFYTRCLVEMPAGGAARAHILERGISPRTVMDFQLGYSPTDLTSPLVEYLDQEGFKMETLVDAGLVPDTSKWKYPTSPDNPRSRVDRFRGRLVVPIRDHRGSVIGFGARDLSDSQGQGSVGSGFVIPDPAKAIKSKGKRKSKKALAKEEEAKALETAAGADATVAGRAAAAAAAAFGKGMEEKKARPAAKYLNSPETSLFKKGKNVFGLDLAKEAIRTQDMAVVVEGYFDVIKLHDAGVRNAVGVLGTAITIDQLQLCARYSKSKHVVLCMDGDDAGKRAVERLCENPSSSGLDSLSEAGVSVAVASIPKDSGSKDPADFLQAHGVEAFRTQVIETAVPWSDWYGDRILAAHGDFAADANAFRRCTDRLAAFISDLSIPTDQTFHVHRFAKVLAGGNEVMQHQLEFDLMTMANEKRSRKNALRKRVGSSPATMSRPPTVNPSAASSSQQLEQQPHMHPTANTETTAALSPALPASAEIRRLAEGRPASSDDWTLAKTEDSPAVAERSPGAAKTRGRKRPHDGGGKGVGGSRRGVLNSAEAAEELRNHEWVMERVKLRNREELRRNKEKYGKKEAIVWSPSMEQEEAALPEEDEETAADDLALRGRILDQAQRFLLTLAVHDPSRRAKCAEEVARHGLYLGSERRQWLFNSLTSSASHSRDGGAGDCSPIDDRNPDGGSSGGQRKIFLFDTTYTDDSDSSRAENVDAEHTVGVAQQEQEALLREGTATIAPGQQLVGEEPMGEGGLEEMDWRPSAEALEAGGDTLLDECRVAAPAGYFGRRMRAGAVVRVLNGQAEGEEETLDWVFDRRRAERVTKGSSTDLVLLEVVMVMLKEQAAAKMHALSDELVSISNAIARTMAEAAAAALFADPSPSASSALQSSPQHTAFAGEAGGTAVATLERSMASSSVDASDGSSGGGGGEGTEAAPAAVSRAGGGPDIAGAGRSREDAQVEVHRLTARQSELFSLIRNQREEVADLEAQRKAFTSRLPTVRAETKAFQQERKQGEAALARRQAALQQPPTSPPAQPVTPNVTQGVTTENLGHAQTVEEEEQLPDDHDIRFEQLPMRFLAEDLEPDEGVNAYDVEGNLAKARDTAARSWPTPPPPVLSPARASSSAVPSVAAGGATMTAREDAISADVFGESVEKSRAASSLRNTDGPIAANLAPPGVPTPPASPPVARQYPQEHRESQHSPLLSAERPPEQLRPPPVSPRLQNHMQEQPGKKGLPSQRSVLHHQQQQHQQQQQMRLVSNPSSAPAQPETAREMPPRAARPRLPARMSGGSGGGHASVNIGVMAPPPSTLGSSGGKNVEAKDENANVRDDGGERKAGGGQSEGLASAEEDVSARLAREAEEQAEMLEASGDFDDGLMGSEGWWSGS